MERKTTESVYAETKKNEFRKPWRLQCANKVQDGRGIQSMHRKVRGPMTSWENHYSAEGGFRAQGKKSFSEFKGRRALLRDWHLG
jgi:hypothetical protein